MKTSSFESQQLPVEISRSGVDGYWKAAHYEPKIGYQCDIVCTHQPCHALKFIQSFQTIGHTKAHTTYTLSFITVTYKTSKFIWTFFKITPPLLLTLFVDGSMFNVRKYVEWKDFITQIMNCCCCCSRHISHYRWLSAMFGRVRRKVQ